MKSYSGYFPVYATDCVTFMLIKCHCLIAIKVGFLSHKWLSYNLNEFNTTFFMDWYNEFMSKL